MGLGAFDWVFIGLAIGSIFVFWWIISRGNFERTGEDDARAFFDEHGRFPDEDPAELAALAERQDAQVRQSAEWDSAPQDFLERQHDGGHDRGGDQRRGEAAQGRSRRGPRGERDR